MKIYVSLKAFLKRQIAQKGINTSVIRRKNVTIPLYNISLYNLFHYTNQKKIFLASGFLLEQILHCTVQDILKQIFMAQK